MYQESRLRIKYGAGFPALVVACSLPELSGGTGPAGTAECDLGGHVEEQFDRSSVENAAENGTEIQLQRRFCHQQSFCATAQYSGTQYRFALPRLRHG